jgi:hypothetical protein
MRELKIGAVWCKYVGDHATIKLASLLETTKVLLMCHIFEVMPRGMKIIQGLLHRLRLRIANLRSKSPDDYKRTATHARNASPLVPLGHSTGSASTQYRG